MCLPTIKSGKFHAGSHFQCGENVVVDVAEELVVGDRCVISDNAYFEGRSVHFGNDCFCYSWEWRRLDVGRGRRDDEHAVLLVGDRCVFHDNKIDLACRVAIGDDVGLSPEVTIYTHGYWLSPLEGFPCEYGDVEIRSGAIIGYRSTLLPCSSVAPRCVVGAHSVVNGPLLPPDSIFAGNPARFLRRVKPQPLEVRQRKMRSMLHAYSEFLSYRGIRTQPELDWPYITFHQCRLNVETLKVDGEEDEHTDDLRDWLFKHGVRFYTGRPFRKLPKR